MNCGGTALHECVIEEPAHPDGIAAYDEEAEPLVVPGILIVAN